MKQLLLFFLFVCFGLQANEVDLFSNDEDPSIFHHVNVITGNLNASFQDVVVDSAKPISIMRTYTSAGALERSSDNRDLKLRIFRHGWLIQGGWNFLPHANLFIEPAWDRKGYKANLAETSGTFISYSYSHKETGKKYIFFLKPDRAGSQASGSLSARTNPKNNLLRMDAEKGEAILYLPNGGFRVYKGPPLDEKHAQGQALQSSFYHLTLENLPNGDRIHYSYDKNMKLDRIWSTNPQGNKTYSSIQFEYFKLAPEFHFKMKTSNHQELSYRACCHEKRQYINYVEGNCRPLEEIAYFPGRKSIGAQMHILRLGGQQQFRVSYYPPGNTKQEQKWAEKPKQKEFHIDKVREVGALVGPNGEEKSVARFLYKPNLTEVRDVDNLLICYHHDSEKLKLIEYFDEKDQLHSTQKFYWDGSLLHCKTFCDAQGNALFAKTFVYDPAGNVKIETVWGNLTGNPTLPLAIDDWGNPSGGESRKKSYSYTSMNLIEREEEEEGLTYLYHYLPGTDLLTAKFTCEQNHILLRQFYQYDEDRILIQEITDDGSAVDGNDLTGITQRLTKRYSPDPVHGLPTTITETYWDIPTHTEKLIKKTELIYSSENRIKEEKIYDAEGVYRYTIYTDYDQLGRIKRKTNSLDQETNWVYDELGHLLELKEVGSPKRTFRYDAAGRQIAEESEGKTLTTSYDAKGRVLSQTDSRGNTTLHSYDYFGNCRQTQFPKTKDQAEVLYDPTIHFGYDLQGNLISTQMPSGDITHTTYNLFRKPTLILEPDGEETHHFYNKDGTLAKTLYADGTELQYTYDSFQRTLSQTLHAQTGEILSQESWTYDAFHLRSHTDPRGLVTSFAYDGAGRKIAEIAENRTTSFTYDSLGFLHKQTEGSHSFVQICDVVGRISEQWEESQGHIENRMQFLYNGENQKIQAIRTTSQGDATDLFRYEKEKLSHHTDPLGAITQFIYEDIRNDLDQQVLRKTTIDPLGHKTIETYDVGERLILREKQDTEGNPVFQQKFSYDRSGNRTQQTTEGIAINWEYDSRGRVIRETEAGKKTIFFQYDSRGRLLKKTLPNGVDLFYTYDGANRLVEYRSSDKSIHYQYSYSNGPEPTQIIDLIHNLSFQRKYNTFGQIIEETHPSGFSYSWEYDENGRCSRYTLPDHSTIHYTYAGAHMNSVERRAPNGTILYTHTYTHFDPNGHVAQEELIHHLGTLQTTHDLLERPSQQNSRWLTQTISYGPSGLVQTLQSTLFGDKTFDYDALNQLKKEGSEEYHFNSLGNPSQWQTNELNQLFETQDARFTYDPNGNPRERITSSQLIQYHYDALDRLTEIINPDQKKTAFFYDPFSRLLAKESFSYQNSNWVSEGKTYYLYDHEKEVGTCTSEGQILQLKVLGLGLKGDIGAAIALELNGTTCVPLHDFTGSIIALLDLNGQLIETHNLNTFGQEQPPHPSISPWSFCSKRNEEGLIFFGKRFYDPTISRWLTPDPSGFTDGPNLYVYVLNSPPNRLDLFGLFSENKNLESLRIDLPIFNIPRVPGIYTLISSNFFNGVKVDLILSCGYWHKLQFTPEELDTGKVNVLDHFSEFFTRDGRSTCITSFGNGINTSFDEYLIECREVINKLDGGMFIGLYNQTESLWADIERTKKERNNIETPIVCVTSEFLKVVSEKLANINKCALWLYIAHSENGVIFQRAFEKLTPAAKEIVQENLFVVAIAPAVPIPKSYGRHARNIYTFKDYVTGFGYWGYALPYMYDSEYDFQIVPCRTHFWERNLFIADHSFLGKTYKQAWSDQISYLSKFHPIYKGR